MSRKLHDTKMILKQKYSCILPVCCAWNFKRGMRNKGCFVKRKRSSKSIYGL